MNRKLSVVLMVAAIAACKGRDKRHDGGDGDMRYQSQRGRDLPTSAASREDMPPEEDESGGTGTAMALEEGKMGKKDSTAPRASTR